MAHAGGFTREEREEYRNVVMDNVMRVMEGMDLLLKKTNIELNDTAKMHAKGLSQGLEKIPTGNGKITREAIGAVQGLGKISGLLTIIFLYWNHFFSKLKHPVT